jgi:hypothetical protein
MKQGHENFKVVKNNPKEKNKNYILQNNKITRTTFYIVVATLLIGIVMVFATGFTFR